MNMNNSQAAPPQSRVFLEGEGNQWFERNKLRLDEVNQGGETGTVKRVLQPFKADIHRIIEIGCSSGAKLADLCSFFQAEGMGIDPSSSAIAHGQQRHASRTEHKLSFEVGTASQLPGPDAQFDLVLFGFCLYLVDRHDVLKAVAEADRVLKPGGFLAILDFDPVHRHQRPYHHKAGIQAYKTSYADFFTAGGHYYLVAKDSFSHTNDHFTPDSDERVSMSILYKETNAY